MKTNMTKKIKCYIEVEVKRSKYPMLPNVWFDKPNDREIKNAHEFGCKYYEAEIILKEELK